MGRPVIHWELLSKDLAKISDFYEKVFDWNIQHIPEMNYRFIETGGQGGINGGIMQPARDEPWPGNMNLLHRRRRPRGLSPAHRRGRRQDPYRGAGCAWHGRFLAFRGS
jgi:hypothetical protein